jgi:chemosensory pili system protein ChpA (sensor histidine kinase/response regulator)
MRTLHTFKGGARLAGAMRLGEMAHRLETTIEQLAATAPVPLDQIEPLPARADAMAAAFEALSRRPAPAWRRLLRHRPRSNRGRRCRSLAELGEEVEEVVVAQPLSEVRRQWLMCPHRRRRRACARGLLDRLVNQAGEVSITRARIDADVRQLQGTLVDLTDNLDRMRKPVARHRTAGRNADQPRAWKPPRPRRRPSTRWRWTASRASRN